MYGQVLIITNVPVQSLTKKAVISYGADLHQVEVLMLHWGCRTIVKAASRVMAWLGNSRLSAQHCIVRNQSINNCYSMFMCHVSMTKRSHLVIRVLKLKAKMTNDKYFCLVGFFILNAWLESTVYWHWQAFHSHSGAKHYQHEESVHFQQYSQMVWQK